MHVSMGLRVEFEEPIAGYFLLAVFPRRENGRAFEIGNRVYI